jgi:glycosyltransferase involved in cell wall biosynthesis
MAFAYLFKSGRRERLENITTHGPTEFFFGYPQLRASGLDVDLLQDNDFGLDKRPVLLWRAINHLTWVALGLPFWATYRLAQYDARACLRKYRAILVTTNSFGISLALLKRLGLCKPRVVFIAMGLIETAPPLPVRWFYGHILRHVTLAVISRPEREHLAALFPKISVCYVPFGVDHCFWTPGDRGAQGDYVLSIGNDSHRDYATLIHAWRSNFPELRIVTRLTILTPLPANIKVISGDWRTQVLSDEDIRNMVQGSRFVVVPIRDTIQPSGQSACLQAMACGKAVILSETEGLWDRALMVHGKSCLLVPCGSPVALRTEISNLLANQNRAEEIGRAARQVVEEHLNVDVMAKAVKALCLENLENAV